MREEPPKDLIERLQRLGLATPRQVRGVQGRVRRLARELPLFESVWVDALAQSRSLTRYQAAELNAGRGQRLRVGPFLLCEKLPCLGYADQYRARRVGTSRTVRLAVVERSGGPPDETQAIVAGLNELAASAENLNLACLAPVMESGSWQDRQREEDGRIWVSAEDSRYRSAAEWMAPGGRFAPRRVVRIAQTMLHGLVAMEVVGLPHGDIGASNLLLAPDDRLVLAWPGLRGILRPEEGYAAADLPPEFFDTLAPERVSQGGPPTIKSDIYACGCLWRHLLTGRPTIPGGDALAKLRGHQTAGVEDVRRLAPDTPARLAKAVSACLARDAHARPESMAALAAMLGPVKSTKASAWLGHSARRGSPDPAETTDRRPPVVSPESGGETFGRPFRQGRETLAERVFCRLFNSTEPHGLQASRATRLRWTALAGCLLVAVLAAWSTLGPWRETPMANSGTEPSRQRTRNDAAGVVPFEPNGASASTVVHPPPAQSNVASPDTAADAPRPTPLTEEDDLVLPAGEPLSLASLDLRPGQTVRGQPGSRPTIVTPPNGLVVSVEDVRFERIDFLWQSPAGDVTGADLENRALLRVRASRCEFHGCTFRASESRAPAFSPSDSAAVIHWTYPLRSDPLELPSGRLRLRDCVFVGVPNALVCSTQGAITLEMTNVLGVEVGSLISLDHWPSQDEPTAVSLTNVTLRDSGSLVECHCIQPVTAPGVLSVQASGCVLMLRPQAPLLCFSALETPQPLLSNVYWTGEGSLVSPAAMIAGWRLPHGGLRSLDDGALAISGLVHGEVEFSGPARQGAESNQVVDWQAPLRSSNPPGVAAKGLTWPRR